MPGSDGTLPSIDEQKVNGFEGFRRPAVEACLSGAVKPGDR
jgi:hypothetical protein